MLALGDQIRQHKIHSGDKIVFGISASGLTTGTGLYVLDDLPDRIRQTKSEGIKQEKKEFPPHSIPVFNSDSPKVRIVSIGLVPEIDKVKRDSLEMLEKAAELCLKNSSYECREIGLLLHAGVYRSENLLEPAYAALLAGKLDMNSSLSNLQNEKTLAFDLFNGALGFLQACYLAEQMIGAGNCSTAMVTAAEFENNLEWFPEQLLGVEEAASAVILDKDPEGNQGFIRFLFKYHPEIIDSYTTYCSTEEVRPYMHIDKVSNLEELYLSHIPDAVEELLNQEGLDLIDLDWIFPPQISSDFVSKLSLKLEVPQHKMVNVSSENSDLFSSSLPFGIDHARTQGWIKPKDKAMFISVGSGIQIGCALYQF
jgi:3-oxoacyl-[acyl-carrier-protein] synthase III